MPDENQGQKDPLKVAAENLKVKLAMGKFIFDNVVLPRAKEVAGRVKEAAEGKLNDLRDSFDPTRGLEKNSVEARDWLITKGFSPKRANEVIVETVTKALKENKQGGKKNE